MHQEMAVDTSPNRWATFIRQMIPHHLNAVAMSKLVLKQSTFEEDGEGDSEAYDELKALGAPQPLHARYSCLLGSWRALDRTNMGAVLRCLRAQSSDKVALLLKAKHYLILSSPTLLPLLSQPRRSSTLRTRR
jgi:hypothetical protein